MYIVENVYQIYRMKIENGSKNATYNIEMMNTIDIVSETSTA